MQHKSKTKMLERTLKKSTGGAFALAFVVIGSFLLSVLVGWLSHTGPGSFDWLTTMQKSAQVSTALGLTITIFLSYKQFRKDHTPSITVNIYNETSSDYVWYLGPKGGPLVKSGLFHRRYRIRLENPTERTQWISYEIKILAFFRTNESEEPKKIEIVLVEAEASEYLLFREGTYVELVYEGLPIATKVHDNVNEAYPMPSGSPLFFDHESKVVFEVTTKTCEYKGKDLKSSNSLPTASIARRTNITVADTAIVGLIDNAHCQIVTPAYLQRNPPLIRRVQSNS